MAAGTDQAINAPRVLLLGASSQIGVFAIPRLVKAGCHVLALSRKGKPAGYPSFEQVQWLSGPGLNERESNELNSTNTIEDCQYLLSAGPMELAQKFLATANQFKAAVVFSSSSVEVKQASPNLSERKQMDLMRALESQMKLAAKSRGLSLLILRPTLIYGCGLDTNISRLASWIRRFGFIPVNGKAAGLRQPVHADDLAEAAISALFSKKTLPGMLFLTGGETLSYTDMVARIFKALGKPVRLARLPQWMFVLLVKLVSTIKPGAGINSEMVRRQGLDLVFDDTQARELLAYNPRPFSPVAKDFSPLDF